MERAKIEKLYSIGIVLVFALGIAIRLYNFLLNPSLWFDEASLAINLYNCNIWELFKGLGFLQACPPFFLLFSKLALLVFHPNTDYFRDLILRLLPFISGIAALPAFYYLVKLISKAKRTQFFALTFLALNPCAILYSAQFKQYSTELLVSIVLLIIFYKLIFLSKRKWYYTLIIAISPWFSYSSLFIILSGYFALLIKDKKLALFHSIPIIISIALLYIVNIKSALSVNYAGMDNYWAAQNAFFSFNHPIRGLLKFGQLCVMPGKYQAVLCGIILFIPMFITAFTQKTDISKKIYYLMPLILTLLVSGLHKYPIEARLVLFLLPLLCIQLALYEQLFFKLLTLIFLLLTILFTPHYVINHCGINTSSARSAIHYLTQNAAIEDALIIEHCGVDYLLYLKTNKLQNKIITLPNCDLDDEKCKAFLKELPNGNYYLLTTFKDTNKIIDKQACYIDKLHKALFIEKF